MLIKHDPVIKKCSEAPYTKITFEPALEKFGIKQISDDLYKSLSNVSTVVSPSRINNIFHFYGRERSVFFDIVKEASESFMIDLSVKKLGLRDLMDSEFAGGGLDWLEH